ncbi:MAG: hypothetical protein ACO1RT_13970, partial [Planctomycetaceae bacterium]
MNALHPHSTHRHPTLPDAKPAPAELGDETLSLVSPLPRNRFAVFAALAIGGAVADLWAKEVVFRWRGLPQE